MAITTNPSRFGGMFNASAFAYGINPNVPELNVGAGPNTNGVISLTPLFAYTTLADGTSLFPLSSNAPIQIGSGAVFETVTPTAVANPFSPVISTCIVTLTASFAHGAGDIIRSGTAGFQEAVNYAASIGGGVVMIDQNWASYGGTNAMLSTAIVPSYVYLYDCRFGGGSSSPSKWNSVTPISAPTALTTAASTFGMITTSTSGGTIATGGAYRLGVTYVDSNGGETILSTDTAGTAVVTTGAGSTNSITVTSPAAVTGAIGYRVYMTAASGASLTEILYPVGNAAITGTPVILASGTSAPAVTSFLPCFQIGTPVTINTIITGTAKVPSFNNAYIYVAAPVNPGASLVLPSTWPPFTAVGAISAGTKTPLGVVNLPPGFLNTLGRTLRIQGLMYATQAAVAGTHTMSLDIASITGVTVITPFTAVSPATGASIITISALFEIWMTTTAVGTSGTVECHGTVAFNVAGTAVTSPAQDLIIAASSAVNLTVGDALVFNTTPTTTNDTAAQLRQLLIEAF